MQHIELIENFDKVNWNNYFCRSSNLSIMSQLLTFLHKISQIMPPPSIIIHFYRQQTYFPEYYNCANGRSIFDKRTWEHKIEQERITSQFLFLDDCVLRLKSHLLNLDREISEQYNVWAAHQPTYEKSASYSI